jgi:hypothetical protein
MPCVYRQLLVSQVGLWTHSGVEVFNKKPWDNMLICVSYLLLFLQGEAT